MKKTISTLLSMLCAFVLIVMLGACNANSQYVGTYKMVSISGTVTANGITTELNTDLYDYYNITLNADGTAKVESKAAASTALVEAEGTWEVKDGKIRLMSESAGVTVVEEMNWENDTITYVAEQSASGMTISMTLVLQKVVEE